MIVAYKANSMEPNRYSSKELNVHEVSICPICKKSIKPIHLNTVYQINSENIAIIESHLFCKGCNSSFIVRYESPINPMGTVIPTNPVFSVPNTIKPVFFEDSIHQLSPQFIKIYNQASEAEASALDEIAGIGYRKSLEFLIKDFAISEHPDEKDTIKSMNLSPCINKYISDPSIKTLATKSAWIGNDEAHYVRKHENRDISDMKKFIQASVHFISIIQITKDADSMELK